MRLNLTPYDSGQHKSKPQKIRVSTESWAEANLYCPACESRLVKYPNNRPVADFFCRPCAADFELKSTGNKIGAVITDGAYGVMMERLASSQNPHLFLLQYDQASLQIINLLAIPRYFFIPALIVKRKPLAATARRAGWVGCNILIGAIPSAGKIHLVRNGVAAAPHDVGLEWKKSSFLENEKDFAVRGWLQDIMICIDQIGTATFTLEAMYGFETQLALKYPANSHIKEKIRQQLQLLRDKDYLSFHGQGVYSIK